MSINEHLVEWLKRAADLTIAEQMVAAVVVGVICAMILQDY